MNTSKIPMTLKLLFSGIVCLSLFGFTASVLQDVETSSNNQMKLGTLNLQVGDTDPTSYSFDFSNMKPGEIWQSWVDINSIGSLSGNFWMNISMSSSLEAENPESETNTEEPGDLPGCVEMRAAMSNDEGTETVLFDYTPVSTLIDNPVDAVTSTLSDEWVESNQATLNIQARADACDSSAMGDTVSLDIDFHLDQI